VIRFAKPAAMAICLASSGCAHYYSVGSIVKHGAIPEQGGQGFYDAKTHQIDAASPAFQAALTAARNSQADRNALIAKMVLVSDDGCLRHKSEIEAMANSVNLTFGALTTLFAGTATVIGAESTAKALSAAAAASNASRSLVNEEVYKKAFSTSILRAIDTERDALRSTLVAGMSLGIDKYAIDIALLDVSRYHASCSFIAGISTISQSLEQRPATSATVQTRIELLQQQMTRNDARKVADPTNAAAYDGSNARLQQQIDELYRDLSRAPE
jgi:hypothetical protein